MARRRQAPEGQAPSPQTDEPLLHEAQRLIVEAGRVAGTSDPDDPDHKVRLASLIAELDGVRHAMTEQSDAIRQQADTIVHQVSAVSAYNRTAKTLTNGRKRP